MATKKQKRQEALAKREQFMQQVRLDGQRAIEKSRARQQKRAITKKNPVNVKAIHRVHGA